MAHPFQCHRFRRRAGDAGRGVYMTYGTINVALLDYKGGKIPDMNNEKPLIGTIHFGMWVDDLEEAEAQATAAGLSASRRRHVQLSVVQGLDGGFSVRDGRLDHHRLGRSPFGHDFDHPVLGRDDLLATLQLIADLQHLQLPIGQLQEGLAPNCSDLTGRHGERRHADSVPN